MRFYGELNSPHQQYIYRIAKTKFIRSLDSNSHLIDNLVEIIHIDWGPLSSEHTKHLFPNKLIKFRFGLEAELKCSDIRITISNYVRCGQSSY